jgi:hypothetical protein
MPQLDIYRAFDEIIIILLLIGITYLMFILIVLPLLIKRIGLIKNQQEIKEIEIWNRQTKIVKQNLITKDNIIYGK